MQSQLLSLGGVVDPGGFQRLKEKEQLPGDYQALQARIIQLEGQVRRKRDTARLLSFQNVGVQPDPPVCYRPGEDPAAGARPKSDVAGECPAAA